MKRVLALLLCLVLVMAVFVSCKKDESGATATPGEKDHVHTYDTDLSKDANGHWYEPTCGCEAKKTAHADKNNDGLCDVCEYSIGNHAHTYSEEWTVDCTNHWHAADCGHIVAGSDVAKHADENADGKCDVCAYVINDIHKHYYDTAWTNDAEYHWHAALCEHNVEVDGKAAHEVNAAGYCTVCEAKVKDVDTTKILAVLEAALAQNDKIIDGSVIASQTVYGGTGKEFVETGLTNRVYFVLGNGQSYINYKSYDVNDLFIGVEEQWFQRLSDEEVFGVVLENGKTELAPTAGDAQFLNGYSYYPGSILPSDSDDTSTLANTLLGLYNQMKAGERVSNAAESYDAATGLYTFSYTYYSVNAATSGGAVFSVEIELYNVDVEFSINSDYVIDVANFEVEVYRDYEADSDLDYKYVDNGNGNVTISDLKLKATANPTVYSYNVSQNSGERTFTTPYPKSSLLPKSFEFYYVTKTEWDDNYTQESVVSQVKIDDYFEVDAGTYAKFSIGNMIPMTASLNFLTTDDFTFSFVNNDPNSTAKCWYESDSFLNGYSAYSRLLKLKLRDPGEYTVTIGFGSVTKTFTLKVLGETKPTLPENTDTTINVLVTDNNTWVDKYSYTAKAEGTYTFTVPAGIGVWNVNDCDNNPFTTQPEVDYYGNGGTFSVGLKANEKFEFYVASAEKGKTAVITVAFEAGTVSGGDNDDNQGGNVGGGTIADDISGTYTSGAAVLVINKDGTMTFTNGSNTSNYTYVINGNNVTYTLNGNAPYDSTNGMAQYFGYLTFGADGKPASFWNNGTEYVFSAGGDEGGDTVDISGTYYSGNAVLVINKDGTMTFTNGDSVSNYTYVISGDTVTYTLNGNAPYDSTNAMASYFGYLTFGADGKPATFWNNGTEYTLSTTAGGNEGGDGETTVTLTGTYASADSVLKVEFNGNVVTFTHTNPMSGFVNTLSFNYTVANGVVSLTDATTGAAAPSMYGITLTDGVPTSATWEGFPMDIVVYTGNEGGGEGEDPKPEASVTIYDDMENTVTVTANDKTAGKIYVSFTPYNSGEYNFNSNDLWVVALYDATGKLIEKNENWYYDLTMYESYTIEINLQYVEAGSYTITPEYQYPAGHQNNPIWLTLGENTTANYKGNYSSVWYQFYANATGTITITDLSNVNNVTLMITTVFGNEVTNEIYNDVTFTSSYTKTLTLDVVQGRKYYIGIAAFESTTAVDIAFKAEIVAGDITTNGSINVPHNLVIGNNTAAVGDLPVYFAYSFTASGTLTLTTTNNNCLWYITNDLSKYVESTANATLSYEGYEGDTVYVCVSTANWQADNIPFTASLKAAPTEVYFEGQVNTNGSNTITIADNTWASLSFNGMGQYQISWDNANVKVELLSFFADNTVLTNGGIISGDMWGTNLKIYFPEYAAGTVNLTIVPYVEPAKNLTVGENTVSVTDTQMGNTVNLPVSNENDVTYTVTVGTNGVVIYNSSNYFAGNTVDITVPAGQTVSFNVATYDYSASDVVITVAIKASAEGGDNSGDNGNSQPNLKGSGTQSDPYIIESLPFEITVEGTHDFFIRGTAAADCVLVITYPDGGFVSNLPEGWTRIREQ